jgi:hypothetical protein
MKAIQHIMLAGCLSGLLTGCIDVSPYGGILSSKASVPAGESVIFGEITKNLNVRGDVGLIEAAHSWPVMRQPVDGTRTFFCWHLPPGKYAIWNFIMLTSSGIWTGESSLRLYAEFEVGQAGQMIYVGQLDLRFEQNRLKASVADDFDNAVKELKSKYPHLSGEPVRELLQIEQEK